MTSWVDQVTGEPVATTGTGYSSYLSSSTIVLSKSDPTKAGVAFTAAGQALELWPALTFSAGQSFVVFNDGAFPFLLQEQGGATTIGQAQTGTAYYLTLLDNTTTGGVWDVPRPLGGSGTGTVTSIALTMPSIFTVSGSPIFSGGTIEVTQNAQVANSFLSGPTSGAAAAPAYRAIVPNDMPTFVGDSGSGGIKGAVPAPAAGDAAAGKFLSADGTFDTPGGTGASTSNQYLVLSAAGDLTQQRIFTAGTGLTGVDAGAGAAFTLSVTNPLPAPSGNPLTVPRVNASANAYEAWMATPSTMAQGDLLYASTTSALAALNKTTANAVLRNTGTNNNPKWEPLSAPQITVLTAGSGTYTTPTRALYLMVELVGAGGGGGGASAGTGGNGGTTAFGGTMSGLGGTGGGPNGGTGGLQGNATGGDVNLGGGMGGTGASDNNALQVTAGHGGNSFFGGGGYGGYMSDGAAGRTNTGAGGGGGASSVFGGAGGGAGGYAKKIFANPAASYSYSVGTGGAGGAAGLQNGGAGADGLIIIIAHFQ